MFDRKYASRDRRKPRGLIAKRHMEDLARYRYDRQVPLPDVGLDAEDRIYIDGHERTLRDYHISRELWARYTTPIPFCTVPLGGTDPKKHGGVMPKNPFRKPTERAAEVSLVKLFSKESSAKLRDELPAEPTWAEQVAKAGGRPVEMPSASSVAEWHELDA